MHRKHLRSQNEESSTAYSTHFSKVSGHFVPWSDHSKSDHSTPWFFCQFVHNIVRTFPESLRHEQKQGHYSCVYLVLLPIRPRRFCRKTCFEASRAVFWSLSCYKELKLTCVPPSRYIQFAAFWSRCKILACEVWACAESKISRFWV